MAVASTRMSRYTRGARNTSVSPESTAAGPTPSVEEARPQDDSVPLRLPVYSRSPKEYFRVYALIHRDEIREKKRAWYLRTRGARREQTNDYRTAYRARVRGEAMRLLGGKCIRCGFSDPRALQFDHINGGGHKELRGGGELPYLLAISRGQRPDIQVLCSNCNWIKRAEHHETSKGWT